MNQPEADDVALKLLHTADWHLGRRFPSFPEKDETELTRARFNVLDKILAVAEQRAVDAVLCAGDLFDEPSPEPEWWQPVVKKLAAWRARIPMFLLPGNHDPLQLGSVYHPDHGFRRALPPWVRVVDDDHFTARLNDTSVLHAKPCRSSAGQDDPALALPAREPGDPTDPDRDGARQHVRLRQLPDQLPDLEGRRRPARIGLPRDRRHP